MSKKNTTHKLSLELKKSQQMKPESTIKKSKAEIIQTDKG